MRSRLTRRIRRAGPCLSSCLRTSSRSPTQPRACPTQGGGGAGGDRAGGRDPMRRRSSFSTAHVLTSSGLSAALAGSRSRSGPSRPPQGFSAPSTRKRCRPVTTRRTRIDRWGMPRRRSRSLRCCSPTASGSSGRAPAHAHHPPRARQRLPRGGPRRGGGRGRRGPRSGVTPDKRALMCTRAAGVARRGRVEDVRGLGGWHCPRQRSSGPSGPVRGPIVAQTSRERAQQPRALGPKLGPKRAGIAGDSC